MRGMASRISASVTLTAKPPESFMAITAARPSRGTLTEMLSAMVLPETGCISPPLSKALLTASECSACTATSCGRRSIMPRRWNSTKPFQMPLMILPSPTDTKTLSGVSQLSCSQISNEQVFLPSRVSGLMPVLRLYQPYSCEAFRQRSKASS